MNKLNNRGQALVEYVLIITLIVVVAISAAKIFGGRLKDSITKTSCELIGEKYQEGSKAGEGTCK